MCTVSGCGLKHTKFLHLLRSRDSTSTDMENKPTISLSVDAPPFVSTSPGTSSNVTCTVTGARVGKAALPIVPVKVRGK